MLSNTDNKGLQKELSNRETWARSWPTTRLIFLAVGIFQIWVAIYGFSQMQELAKFNSAAEFGISLSDDITLADKVLDARLNLLRQELQMYVGIILSGCVGALFCMYSLLNWAGRQNLRQVAYLRHILQLPEE